MQLLDRTGKRPDSYVRVGADAIAGLSHALVDWTDLPQVLAQRSRDQRIGVEVPSTVRVSEVRLVQRQLSLVGIRFASFSEGRGFSLAKQLRNNGFSGTLRAVGPLIADQFPHAVACGFDEVEVPDDLAVRQPVEQWLTALTLISHSYQRGYGDAGNILKQGRAARDDNKG
jgi:uncharacterized protein (DUF934 family)